MDTLTILFSITTSVRVAPVSPALIIILYNLESKHLSKGSKVNGQTGGQMVANSIAPLPHFVRRGTKMCLKVILDQA